MNWEGVQSTIATPSLALQTFITPWDKILCIETVQTEKKLNYLLELFCTWYWIFMRKDKQHHTLTYQHVINNISFHLRESNLETLICWKKAIFLCFYKCQRGKIIKVKFQCKIILCFQALLKTTKIHFNVVTISQILSIFYPQKAISIRFACFFSASPSFACL